MNGWKLVPVEPTAEMLAAGQREHAKSPTNANPYHKYAAMLAAAPVPPAGVIFDEVAPITEQAWRSLDLPPAGEVEFLMKRATELKAERDALQSELTKARERAANLESVLLEVRGCLERPDVRQHGWEDRCLDRMYAMLPVAQQSAPAAQALSMENQRVVTPEQPITGPHPLEVSMGPGARSGSIQSAPAAKGGA